MVVAVNTKAARALFTAVQVDYDSLSRVFSELGLQIPLLQHRHKEQEVLSNSVTPTIVNTCRSGYTFKKYLEILDTVIIVAHSFKMSDSRNQSLVLVLILGEQQIT